MPWSYRPNHHLPAYALPLVPVIIYAAYVHMERM